MDFDDVGTLVDHLSSNYTQIKQNIDTIDANGGTNIGAGLQAANSELIGNGTPSHLWVEILLTDGHEASTNYAFTSQQIQEAVDNNIAVFTVGLGIGVNETLLKEIADRTGGRYYFAMNAEALEEIYSRIGLLVFDIAGRDTNVTDSVPMIRDVLPSHIHVDYGSFSIFPENIYNNTDGLNLEWNLSQVLVNESWTVSYDVTSSQLGWVPVGVYPKARVEYVTWNNENATMPFPDTLIHVVLPPIDPPTDLRSSVENNADIRLEWTPPNQATVDYYLIYRSEHQTEFDFSAPVYNTSVDVDPGRTNWTDVGAAGPGAPKEYYYTLRAVDTSGSVSTTSNTAGKWTKSLEPGLNSFSIPLEPFDQINVSQLANEIPNSVLIRWMDSNGRWVTHMAGSGAGVNDAIAQVGRTYEISVSSWTNCTFVGFPGSMISHREGFGDSVAFRKSLTVGVQGTNITLGWQTLPGASEYEVYRSARRDGLFEESLQPIGIVISPATAYTDFGLAVPDRQFYYWVIPLTSGGEEGSGTYSVGLWIGSYHGGSDTFALPLKLNVTIGIDELCNVNSEIAGMSYMISGVWKFHAREMPAGVYDVLIEQSGGYQLSTEGATYYIFIGV